MKIELIDDDGNRHDVTEAVQVIYDALHSSMDFGSGFLDAGEAQAMHQLATVAGWEQPTYDGDVCATCGHTRSYHRAMSEYSAAYWAEWEGKQLPREHYHRRDPQEFDTYGSGARISAGIRCIGGGMELPEQGLDLHRGILGPRPEPAKYGCPCREFVLDPDVLDKMQRPM